MKKRKAILTKINPEGTDFMCECGNPVATAYFKDYDGDEILVTSSVEVCNVCGLIIDEDDISDEQITHIKSYII